MRIITFESCIILLSMLCTTIVSQSGNYVVKQIILLTNNLIIMYAKYKPCNAVIIINLVQYERVSILFYDIQSIYVLEHMSAQDKICSDIIIPK